MTEATINRPSRKSKTARAAARLALQFPGSCTNSLTLEMTKPCACSIADAVSASGMISTDLSSSFSVDLERQAQLFGSLGRESEICLGLIDQLRVELWVCLSLGQALEMRARSRHSFTSFMVPPCKRSLPQVILGVGF